MKRTVKKARGCVCLISETFFSSSQESHGLKRKREAGYHRHLPTYLPRCTFHIDTWFREKKCVEEINTETDGGMIERLRLSILSKLHYSSVSASCAFKFYTYSVTLEDSSLLVLGRKVPADLLFRTRHKKRLIEQTYLSLFRCYASFSSSSVSLLRFLLRTISTVLKNEMDFLFYS